MWLVAEAGLNRVLLCRFALIQRDCLAEWLEVPLTKCKKENFGQFYNEKLFRAIIKTFWSQ